MIGATKRNTQKGRWPRVLAAPLSEMVAEARLHKGASSRVELLAARAQHFLYNRWCLATMPCKVVEQQRLIENIEDAYYSEHSGCSRGPDQTPTTISIPSSYN